MSRFTHSVKRVLSAAALSIAWSSAARAQPAWVPTDIGSLGGATTSQAYAVNDNGMVVGTYTTDDGDTHGFVWTAGNAWTDPGTLGGTTTVPRAINTAGQVVGYSSTGTTTHAFLWTAPGGMVDIGTLGGAISVAFGISELGQVVGYSYISGNTAYHAFLWTDGSGMLDLGTLGGDDSIAYGINSAGQVVGEAAVASGYTHA